MASFPHRLLGPARATRSIKGKRCVEDEKLLTVIRECNPTNSKGTSAAWALPWLQLNLLIIWCGVMV
jgi:hypothetical protein